VSNTLTTRMHSILVLCAVLAVMATCATVIARSSLAMSPICHSVSSGDSSPVGYRLP
jgi:hypothetical protein